MNRLGRLNLANKANGQVSGSRYWKHLFITTWDTELAGSATKTIVIPTYSNGYDCVVNWGDGLSDPYVGGTLNTAGTITHVYATTGIKTVSISGIFPQIYFNNGGDCLKLKTIANWGTGAWREMISAFFGCKNMIGTYTDIPDMHLVTTMETMFWDCNLFNSPVNFNTTIVTTMRGTFAFCYVIKQSLASFDMSLVTDVTVMAYDCDINTPGTTTNYDETLISWAAQEVQPNLAFNAGSSKYSAAAAAARDHLITVHGWTITDGGFFLT